MEKQELFALTKFKVEEKVFWITKQITTTVRKVFEINPFEETEYWIADHYRPVVESELQKIENKNNNP